MLIRDGYITKGTRLFQNDFNDLYRFKSCFVYCHVLVPGTVRLTGDRVRGDNSKQYTISTYTPYYHTDVLKQNKINFVKISKHAS